ncbi:MAG: UbiA family prenyltransferase [Bacteroidota bacterium]
MNLLPYLRLMRPANIITAMADILAGLAVSSTSFLLLISQSHTPTFTSFQEISFSNLILLLLSTIGLYGGGVVFNDVFDAKLDAVERPERPIPSGQVSKTSAAILGIWLLMAGIVAAFGVSPSSGLIALIVAILALVYDKYGKHTLLGPINMGLCRGGNLLLGMSGAIQTKEWLIVHPHSSLSPSAIEPTNPFWFNQMSPLAEYWPLALIPVAYIAAITTISRGEVHGGDKRALYLAFGLYGIVMLVIVGLSMKSPFSVWQSLPFLALFAYLIFPPLLRAFKDRQPRNIGLAVKAGVIALIAMDAAIAATFAGWMYGLAVLALLPLSRFLAKIFAVT